jgi:hypothetical protein
VRKKIESALKETYDKIAFAAIIGAFAAILG